MLFVIACIIGLLAVEGYLRYFNPQVIMPRYVESSSYGIRKNIDNIRGFHKTSEFEYIFNTNSQGFRGLKEYKIEKRDDVKRIIVLGDSVALGHGVADDETFSFVLEKMLNEKGIKSEVINMGVSGFGTAEELIQYENLSKNYRPDVIILSYFPNDPYNNAVSGLYKLINSRLIKDNNSYEPALRIRDNLNRLPFYNFLAQHSHLLNFLRNYFSQQYIKKLGRARNVWEGNPDNPDDHIENEYLELTAALLNRFKEVCANDKVKLIFLDIPQKNLKSNFPYRLVTEDDDSKIVSIAPAMLEEIRSDSNNNNPLWYEVDGHPTANGHALIAKELYRHL